MKVASFKTHINERNMNIGRALLESIYRLILLMIFVSLFL